MKCYYYEKLTNLDLSSFNTKNFTNMSDMFNRCENLIEIIKNKININLYIKKN